MANSRLPDQAEGNFHTAAVSEDTVQEIAELRARHVDLDITEAALRRVLEGVAVAFKASEDHVKAAAEWLDSQIKLHGAHSSVSSSQGSGAMITWTSLLQLMEQSVRTTPSTDGIETLQLASVAVAVTFLREASRNEIEVTVDDLESAWQLLYIALTRSQQSSVKGNVSRSAQGFLAVPLCSLVSDGNIEELFRLHVWMPDGQRGFKEFAIHSHQPFAQSWILAGSGINRIFDVQPEATYSLATHAEYALSWDDGKSQSTTYTTHQVSSIVKNTHKYVIAKPAQEDCHVRNDTYTVPSATFHTSGVEGASLHATLFFFDSSRGFDPDARILGPKDAEESRQVREVAGVDAASLAETVQVLRTSELGMRQELQDASNGPS